MLYCLKKELEDKINYLDYNFHTICLSKETLDEEGNMKFMYFVESLKEDLDGMINTKWFIGVQSDNYVFLYNLYEYDCVETWEARVEYAKT